MLSNSSEGLQCSPDVDATIDYYECDVHVDACNQINPNTWKACTAFEAHHYILASVLRLHHLVAIK